MTSSATGRVFTFCGLLFLLAIHPAKAQQKAEWTWKDGNGNVRTISDLQRILAEHNAWLEPGPKHGRRAHLSGANLERADLSGANLERADLSGANLERADLSGANLRLANLKRADVTDADLTRTNLDSARLSGAILGRAKLTGANLNFADLSGATLFRTDLSGASLIFAELGGAIFEPEKLQETAGLATVERLELLTYGDNPSALVRLRKQFADDGFREQERKITYALKRREAELLWDGCKSRKTGDETRAMVWSSDSNLANCGSFVLNRVFFDWTCQYGMSPGRTLSLGALVWFLCSVLYFALIHTSGEAGLYRVYAPSVQENSTTAQRVERILPGAKAQERGLQRIFSFLQQEWVALRASMFFSLMSAFNIGFRDINFGRWLRLLTRQEFDIKAVGWARVVAGWQSLLSVYFIALWVLTYFGRPFG